MNWRLGDRCFRFPIAAGSGVARGIWKYAARLGLAKVDLVAIHEDLRKKEDQKKQEKSKQKKSK